MSLPTSPSPWLENKRTKKLSAAIVRAGVSKQNRLVVRQDGTTFWYGIGPNELVTGCVVMPEGGLATVEALRYQLQTAIRERTVAARRVRQKEQDACR